MTSDLIRKKQFALWGHKANPHSEIISPEAIPMQQRKSRIVNFRVTEEEYERLRSASVMQGNGLSAYARYATLKFAEYMPVMKPNDTSPELFLASLSELKQRVTELELKVELLSDGAEAARRTCA